MMLLNPYLKSIFLTSRKRRFGTWKRYEKTLKTVKIIEETLDSYPEKYGTKPIDLASLLRNN